MIINISRNKEFKDCRTKTWNHQKLGLESMKTAEPLLVGGAFHKGIEVFFLTGDRAQAREAAEDEYRLRLGDPNNYFPEERALVEHNIELCKRIVDQYAAHYDLGKESFQVLYPEVEFLLDLPGSEHHCYFVHKILYPEDTSAEGYDKRGFMAGKQCGDSRCYITHKFKGKTDGVIAWKKMLWILEHKTSVFTGDIFYARYELDEQITGYIYGVARKLNIRVHGAVVNLIKKPSKNRKNYDPLDISFEREAFLRSEKDLQGFENMLIGVANDYEEMMRLGGLHVYPNTANCLKFNRRCYYHELCKRNGEVQEGEFIQRSMDYVDLSYYDILGLPKPFIMPTSLTPDQLLEQD